MTWWVPALLAFAVALSATPLAGTLGRRWGILDRPGELTIHPSPIPRTGGLAMLLALGAALSLAWALGLLAGEVLHPLLGLLLGTCILAAVGLLDDARGLSPLHKLLGEILGAAVAVGLGVRIGTIPSVGLASGLTLFFLVGTANALNLLDGMNGLADGVASIAALGLAGLGFVEGQPLVWVPALALAGACLGFLPHNFPQARIFMGDTGSLFLGFALGGLASLLANTPNDWPGLLAPILVLALPLTDTVLAIARRFLNHRGLFSGDREHLYDLLARRGPGERGAVLFIWAIAVILVGVALVTSRLAPLPAALLAVVVLAGLIAWAVGLGALGGAFTRRR